MRHAFAIAYHYKKDDIAKAIENDKEFGLESKLPLLEDLLKILPLQEGQELEVGGWIESLPAKRIF